MKNRLLVILGIIILLIGLAGLAFVRGMNPSYNMSNNTYVGTSLSKAENKLNNEIKLPDFLANEENTTFTVINGSEPYFCANGQRFKYQVAYSVHYDKDLAKTYLIDSEYNLDKFYSYSDSNSDVQYVRCRSNGKDTVIDLYTINKTFDLIMQDYDAEKGLDVLLSSIGIDTNLLEESTVPNSDNSNEIVVESEGVEYNHKNFEYAKLGISINLPVYDAINIIDVAETLKEDDTNDKVSFILDGKLFLIVEQTATKEDINNIDIDSYDTDQGYTIEYFKTNPFEIGSTDYAYYNYLINSIEEIEIRLLD